MALNAQERHVILSGASVAKKLLEICNTMEQLNAVYDSDGGLKTTITQQNLDASSNNGLIKQQLDDGMYAVTTTIKAVIESSKTQLAYLAAQAPIV